MPLVYDVKLLANTVIYLNEKLNSDLDTDLCKSDSESTQTFAKLA